MEKAEAKTGLKAEEPMRLAGAATQACLSREGRMIEAMTTRVDVVGGLDEAESKAVQ